MIPAPRPPEAGVPAPLRERRQRDEKLLRATLSMLCNYVWTKQLRPGEHMWSIPVDAERDFDCILSDAISELVELRAALAVSGEPPQPPTHALARPTGVPRELMPSVPNGGDSGQPHSEAGAVQPAAEGPQEPRRYTAEEIATALSSFNLVVGRGSNGDLFINKGPKPIYGEEVAAAPQTGREP